MFEDARSGGGGWCCPEDGWHGPCAHLLALASAVGAEERLARARELSATGLRGLGVLLEAGDPWAQEVLEDLLGADGESPARPVAPVDVEGAAVLGGLVPAGFTRTSPLPTEERVTDSGAGAAHPSAHPSGTGTGIGTGDADADAEADAGDGAGERHLGDVPDGEGLVDGGPAWSRALRRRVSEVLGLDPGTWTRGGITRRARA
ncbi:hypothetical protein KZX45_18640 [Georgenia sp. EYE_87]|uniref:hypothetical protein n=1 Tax=Georgenia sp. EYE_87 TaxID=2853448 RepID=UPI002003A95C|nr:hypothetical protein [Georgenia sp. EYE_87]MCK6212559.1 hypothetical protein [Georgenia sp. EYE_87]